MYGTQHHSAFDRWWEYAADNYVRWDDEHPVALDLYYDPVVDEHVGRGPSGIIAPTWYFAPQRPSVAKAGWMTAATINGVFGTGPITGLDTPDRAVPLLQFAGEFADAQTKRRIWDAAELHIGPTWNRDAGEFTLRFALDEPHPRGQWNARAMAGWVCTPGAWSRIFNQPNLVKFEQPTVIGVDFPRIALSEARWDGEALHIAAHPQNKSVDGTSTQVQVTNVTKTGDWEMTQLDRKSVALENNNGTLTVDLVADNRPAVIRRSNH